MITVNNSYFVYLPTHLPNIMAHFMIFKDCSTTIFAVNIIYMMSMSFYTFFKSKDNTDIITVNNMFD